MSFCFCFLVQARLSGVSSTLGAKKILRVFDPHISIVSFLPLRYMSTRDTGEQRSLLRVISTMLQLTQEEITAVEARITELERTMVRA